MTLIILLSIALAITHYMAWNIGFNSRNDYDSGWSDCEIAFKEAIEKAKEKGLHTLVDIDAGEWVITDVPK